MKLSSLTQSAVTSTQRRVEQEVNKIIEERQAQALPVDKYTVKTVLRQRGVSVPDETLLENYLNMLFG